MPLITAHLKPFATEAPEEIAGLFVYMGAYSKLHKETYRRIRKVLPHTAIQENIRPDWLVSSALTRLELDIYIPDMKLGIEIQGKQHYEYVPHFHGTPDGFREQLKRDREKRDLCYGNGIRLIEIASDADLDVFIVEIKSIVEPQEKYSYEFRAITREKQIKSKCVPELERAIRNTRRSINRAAKSPLVDEFIRLVGRYNKLKKMCEKANVQIVDPAILAFYENNKERIEKIDALNKRNAANGLPENQRRER